MKCVYCGDNMKFEENNDQFRCPQCKSRLVLIQHPDMNTIEKLAKIDSGKVETPSGNFNREGISTQLIRGYK